MARFLPLVLFGVVLAWTASFQAALAGGWAVVTLETLPAAIEPDREFAVAFWVRQHGQTPVSGLQPALEFSHRETGSRLTFAATAGERAGYYWAVVRLPLAGTWAWSIRTAFGEAPMPPLTVGAAAAAPSARPTLTAPFGLGAVAAVAAAGRLTFSGRESTRRWAATGLAGLAGLGLVLGVAADTGGRTGREPAPVTSGSYEAGQALFVAKGCVTCHRHAEVSYSGFQAAVGPDLTRAGRPGSPVPPGPDYLRAWLKDPPAIRPGTQMPNLGLTDQEVDDLLTFLLNSP